MMMTPEKLKEIRECPDCRDYHRDELLAEIDRLRADRDQWGQACEGRRDEHNKHLEEKISTPREKLAVAVEALERVDPNCNSHMGYVCALPFTAMKEILGEIDRLRAENEKIKIDKYIRPQAKDIMKAFEEWSRTYHKED